MNPVAFVVLLLGNASSTQPVRVFKSFVWLVSKMKKELVMSEQRKRTKPSKRDLSRRPKHGPKQCPGCRMFYNRFKGSFTFASAKSAMRSNDDDSRKWRYRRRHGVLGFLHQLKTSYWHWHIGACTAPKAAVAHV